jgi:hypothetical protein
MIIFKMDIYDTVLGSSLLDSAFAKGKRMFQMALDSSFTGTPYTPEMLEGFANDENGAIVDDGVTVCSYDRWYGCNMEGIYAELSRTSFRHKGTLRTFILRVPPRNDDRGAYITHPSPGDSGCLSDDVEHRLMLAMTELADQLGTC